MNMCVICLCYVRLLAPLSLSTLFTDGGIPFVCGGWGSPYTDTCYKYDAALDTWDISGTLALRRGYLSYGSSDNWGLVIAGGICGSGCYFSTVEFFYIFLSSKELFNMG